VREQEVRPDSLIKTEVPHAEYAGAIVNILEHARGNGEPQCQRRGRVDQRARHSGDEIPVPHQLRQERPALGGGRRRKGGRRRRGKPLGVDAIGVVDANGQESFTMPWWG